MAVSQYFLPRYPIPLLDLNGFDYFVGPACVVRKRCFIRVRSNRHINLPYGTSSNRFLIATKGPDREILFFSRQAWQKIVFQLYSLIHHEFLWATTKSQSIKTVTQYLFDNAHYLLIVNQQQIQLPKSFMHHCGNPSRFDVEHNVNATRLTPCSISSLQPINRHLASLTALDKVVT